MIEPMEAVKDRSRYAALAVPRGFKRAPSSGTRAGRRSFVLAIISLIAISACSGPNQARPVAGESFQGAIRVTTDLYLGHVEPDVAINPLNHLDLMGACQFETTTPAHLPGTFASFDAGRTWRDNGVLPTPSGYDFAADTTVGFDNHGTGFVVALLWQGGGGYESRVTRGGVYLWKTPDGGRHFSAAVPIYSGPGFQDHPWLAIRQTGAPKLFVVWQNEAGLEFVASNEDDRFPAPRLLIAGDSPSNPVVTVGPDRWVSVFFQEFEGTSIHLFVMQSTDDGIDFGPIVQIGSVAMSSLGPGPKGGTIPPPLLGAASDAAGGASAIAMQAFDAIAGHPLIELWQQSEPGGPWHGPIQPADGASSRLSQQQPRLAYSSGRLFLSYFTTNRRNQMAEQVTASSGGPFTSIASFGTTPAPSGFLGDYQGLAIAGNALMAVWNQPIDGHLQIFASPLEAS